ncbi:MAG: hemerythrin domain-containing protein, partial [Candidatus Bathyarchaeota archaeon]
MSTCALVNEEHQEILKKIHLLEEASLDLLKKQAFSETNLGPLKEFLEVFKFGVLQHFEIEEKALFPVLRKASKDKEQPILELIYEHGALIQTYSNLQNRISPTNYAKMLKDFIEALSAHARKELELLPPLMEALNEE